MTFNILFEIFIIILTLGHISRKNQQSEEDYYIGFIPYGISMLIFGYVLVYFLFKAAELN